MGANMVRYGNNYVHMTHSKNAEVTLHKHQTKTTYICIPTFH